MLHLDKILLDKILRKYLMNTEQLISQGNELRSKNDPTAALACYAQAFVADPESASAFNNYGNVMRETGHPKRAVPFLEHARILDPAGVTAEFNLAVALLLMGDYERGWPLYESRWRYEHMDGTKPNPPQPEWTGQDLKDKTILVVGEQGLGDQIQFVRFLEELLRRGAKIKLHVSQSIKTLFESSSVCESVTSPGEEYGEFDYWICMMSLPTVLGTRIESFTHHLQYIAAKPELAVKWGQILGPKKRMRIGVCWSGRRDSWIHQHKSMPVEVMADLIRRHPEHEWINLQVDAPDEEIELVKAAGAVCYPGTITSFADTAALLHHLDVVISVDTAVAHLAGAMGRPVWIPLNAYGSCWRWLLNRDDSPWYPSARLFRQVTPGDWSAPVAKMEKFLSWFKV